MRPTTSCPVCEQDVPVDKKRIVFHLARSIWTDQHYICPGSQSAPSTERTRRKYQHMKQVHRPLVCVPCKMGEHLLCDGGCVCGVCARTLDVTRVR